MANQTNFKNELISNICLDPKMDRSYLETRILSFRYFQRTMKMVLVLDIETMDDIEDKIMIVVMKMKHIFEDQKGSFMFNLQIKRQ